MARYKFNKSSKLKSKSDFKRIFDYKLFVKNDLMALYMAPNHAGKARFAVSVSAKIAPAVIRNRLKRLAREAFRLSQYELKPDFDYIIVFSSSLLKTAISDINPVRDRALEMPDGRQGRPVSNGIKKITLHQIRQSFTELAEKGHKIFEKRK